MKQFEHIVLQSFVFIYRLLVRANHMVGLDEVTAAYIYRCVNVCCVLDVDNGNIWAFREVQFQVGTTFFRNRRTSSSPLN